MIPLFILGYLIFSQALSLYVSLNQGQGVLIDQSISHIELFAQRFAPSFTLEVSAYARQAAGWLAAHIGTIFAETASTIFLIFVTIVAVFYFFRDGKQFIHYLISLSPLPDTQDEHILKRLAQSVRSVVFGTLVVALIQGLLTTVGFAIFGINQPVLWGAVAAVGSLVPGVGTLIVFGPAVVLFLLQGSYSAAIGLSIWGALAVGMIDNVLGPYLMSRGVPLHPFFVLLSVLGGITFFGPIGFIVGPVTLSLFVVLLELYSIHAHSNYDTE
jgi:predicted PurR-regulated permease PerM